MNLHIILSMSLLLRYSSVQVKPLDLKCYDRSNSTSTYCDLYLSCKMVSFLRSNLLVLIITNCFHLSCIKIVISGLEISSLIPNYSKDVMFPLNLAGLTSKSFAKKLLFTR